jgi:hypothetical protein
LLVQVNPFHLVQAAVEVPLEENVPEAVAGQDLAVDPQDALGANEVMLPVQVTAQVLQHLLLIGPSQPGHHLGSEDLAFHAGHAQRRLQWPVQPADALRDHRLHPRRQCLPIQGRSLTPPTVRIPQQITPLLQAAQ